VAKELGLRDSVLRRWLEQRGAARLEPTAAARRPTTQATLPSADHAAEIARFAARERAAAHGARHFKKVDCDLCWSSEMRFRFIEDRRADYPVTVLCDVLGVSPAGYYARHSGLAPA
jgi:hypothetical protein